MPSPSGPEQQSPAPDALRTDYFDGQRAERQAVMLRLTPQGIGFAACDGTPVFWARSEIRRLPGPDDRLILACGDGRARLQVHDPAARAVLLRHIGPDTAKRGTARETRRIVFWLIAATVSILLTALLLIPLLAERIAPLVPPRAEIALGDAVDGALRNHLDLVTCETGPGAAALDRLTARLSAVHALHVEPRAAVVRRSEVNALALPGGRIYVFEGLLRHVDGPDALAGIIAHEIGHVAHRDGLRNLIQAGGTGFLMGLFFGDFIGGGVLAGLAQTSLMATYSRRQELAADRFAAQTLHALGRPTHPFAGFLLDIGNDQPGFFATHPMGEERESAVTALRRGAPSGSAPPLLTSEEWADLRAICTGGTRVEDDAAPS